MKHLVHRDNHDRSGVARVLHVARAFAEASIVAVGFALAILLIGLPVILVVRVLEGLFGWLVGGAGIDAITQTAAQPVLVLSLLAALGMFAMGAGTRRLKRAIADWIPRG